MNFDRLSKNLGWKVKLVPAALYLDAEGELMPISDGDWTIEAAGPDNLKLSSGALIGLILAKDHIRNFTTDTSGDKRGFLTLHVQVSVQDNQYRVVPNHQPGAPVLPLVDRAARARKLFAPELERVFRRQIQILGRIVPNYALLSNGKEPCGDSWASLKPSKPTLFPTANGVEELSTADIQALAEFYAANHEVSELLGDFIARGTVVADYNAWNYLMHKVEDCLRAGEEAVRRFCLDRGYDASMPAAGTLLLQSERALSSAASSRTAFIERQTKLSQSSAPTGRPKHTRTMR